MAANEASVKFNGVQVTVTESDGTDGAIIIFIDTVFEPDGSDGGAGLRVMLNDGDIYIGVAHIDREEE